MLSPSEMSYADASFGLYDQDWRYYAAFLGEPFLLNDCLAYFDGAFLYFCAFPLKDCFQEVSEAALSAALASFPFSKDVVAFDIWGRFDLLPERLSVGGKDLTVALRADGGDSADCWIDVSAFSYDAAPAARLARNAALNKGYVGSVVRLERLSHEHIALMDRFFATHDLSAPHAIFYLAVPNLIRDEATIIVESRREGRLAGFAVISRPQPRAASMTIGFYEKTAGSRAADSVFAALIAFAKAEGIERLHCGYSASAPLLAFKRKWGAVHDGPTYRELKYAADEKSAAVFRNETFLWQQRLYETTRLPSDSSDEG